MNRTKSRWYINSAKALIATLFLLVLLAESSVYGEQDKSIDNNLWTGNWQSRKHKKISGKLVAHIPEKIPQNHTFPVRVEIYYNPESFYKSGKTVKVNFEGLMTETGQVAGGGEASTDLKTQRKLSLKGRPAWSFQVIEYSALINEKTSVITGSYQTKWPSDHGNFELLIEEAREGD